MALAIEHVEDELAPIIQQIAQLLHARIWVTDAQHVVIASTETKSIGCNLSLRSSATLIPRHGAVTLAAPRALTRLGASELLVEQLDGEYISPRLAEAIIELIVAQSTRLAPAQDAHELKNHFVYNLLFEPSLEEDYLIRQGQVLGIDLTIPRAAILIDAANYILVPVEDGACNGASENDEAWMRHRARYVISSVVNFFHLPSDTICAYVGNGEIVILKASSARDLHAWSDPSTTATDEGESGPSWAGLPALKRAGGALLAHIRRDTGVDISVGIGRYHPGVRGLERSYQDARAALSLGRHFHGDNQMHCLDSLGIAAFIGIADERTKIELARHLLGPLDHEPELIETVQTFFAMGCSPSLTSSELSVHRNTLNYRLEKITSLTGLDPRHFDDAVQIRLALLVRSLRK